MSRRRVFDLAAFGLLLWGATAASAGTVPTATAAPEATSASPAPVATAATSPDYAALTREYYAAIDRRDVAALERMLCDRAVMINPRPNVTTREQHLEGQRRPADGTTPPRREWGPLTVHDLGATRLVVGRQAQTGVANAGRFESLVAFHWTTNERGPCVLVGHRAPAGRAAEGFSWDEAFVVGGSFNAQPNAWLVEVAKQLKPGRAVEVAMGQGRNALHLASLGWQVTGYDIAGEGLRIAREQAKARQLKIDTVLASHEDFDFGQERWDLVAFVYAGMPGDTLARAARGLRRGGHVVLEGFHGRYTPGVPGGSATYDRAFLDSAMREAGLEIVRLETPVDARTDFGPADLRPVRLLARKP